MRFALSLFVLFLCGVVGAQVFEKDSISLANGSTLEITFIKHGSLILQVGGKTIHVDPVSEYADYTQFPKADAVLITHEHGDHLDAKALAAIVTPETVLVSNAAALTKLSATQQQHHTMKNGDVVMLFNDAVRVEAVPAYNTTQDRDKFHPKHRDNGYILTFNPSPDKPNAVTRLYIAGDTEDIPEMTGFRPIDVAFVPVNQPYTMTPAQAANAVAMLKAKIVYPYHFGETSVIEIKEQIEKLNSGTEVRLRKME